MAPGRTRRQWAAVAAAALGTLLLIEVALGARGAKPNQRPLYFVAYGVEWVFMRGSGQVGAALGYVIYHLYQLCAWIARLAGPILGDSWWPLVKTLFFWLFAINEFFKQLFMGMGQDDANAQGLAYSLYAMTLTGIGIILFIQAMVRACSLWAKKESQASSASPQPAQASSAAPASSGKWGKAKRGSWS
jgi:hypothetical protein